MNIVVFQGTPKSNSDLSHGHSYIDFMAQVFEEHTFTSFKVGAKIGALEKKETAYRELVDAVAAADGVLWVVPVFSALVPSQVKAFVELIDADEAAKKTFANKYAATITTSAHILDHFAGRYIQAVCEDWQMRFVDTFFGTILPVIDDQYKKDLSLFGTRFLRMIEEKRPTQRTYKSSSQPLPSYEKPEMSPVEKQSGKRIALITDIRHPGGNLSEMIDTFCAQSRYEVTVIDLAKHRFSDCNSCLKCAESLTCAIKDGYQKLHEDQVMDADGIVIAGEIRDRYLSAKIKRFLDREFYMNHIPGLKGKPFGLIISGNLKDNPFVRESIISIHELRGASFAGCISDESEESETTASLLELLAFNLSENIEKESTNPLSFYGVGAQRLIRDFVFVTKYPFIGEQGYFKKTSFKSFPQKRIKARLLARLMRAKSKLSNSDSVLKAYKKTRADYFRSLLFD